MRNYMNNKELFDDAIEFAEELEMKAGGKTQATEIINGLLKYIFSSIPVRLVRKPCKCHETDDRENLSYVWAPSLHCGRAGPRSGKTLCPLLGL